MRLVAGRHAAAWQLDASAVVPAAAVPAGDALQLSAAAGTGTPLSLRLSIYLSICLQAIKLAAQANQVLLTSDEIERLLENPPSHKEIPDFLSDFILTYSKRYHKVDVRLSAIYLSAIYLSIYPSAAQGPAAGVDRRAQGQHVVRRPHVEQPVALAEGVSLWL